MPTPEPAPEPTPEPVEEGGPTTPSPHRDKARYQGTAASSVESAALAPRYAVDGTEATRWSSKPLDNQWWRVDLGSIRQVNKVSINWEAAYASKYRIETSRDGAAYSTAAIVSISRKGRVTTKLKTRSARFLRVTGVTRGTRWGISFYDFEVYGPTD